MNNQNYLQSKLNAEKFTAHYIASAVLLIFGALMVGLAVLLNNGRPAEDVAFFILLAVGLVILLMGVAFLIRAIRTKNNLTRRKLFKSHKQAFNLNTADDFHKLDAMVTEDLNAGMRYRHPAFAYGRGVAITNRFVILNFDDNQPVVMDASKILLIACSTRTVQTSRYSSVTYYELSFFGADDKKTCTMANELDQQEGGMKMAISLGVLFSPDNRPFEAIYKRDKPRFISDALREARLLYNPATISPPADINAYTQVLEPITQAQVQAPDALTQTLEQAPTSYQPNLQTDIDTPL